DPHHPHAGRGALSGQPGAASPRPPLPGDASTTVTSVPPGAANPGGRRPGAEGGQRTVSARTRLVAACVAVGALVAGACGGDDGAETATSVDQGIKEGIESQLGGSATTAAGQEEAEPHPTSMEEWEALWAEERAAMVARITANGWGKSADGTKL